MHHPDEVQLLAISTDSHEDSRKMVRFVKERGLDLTIPLLADPSHKVISRYGLLNMGSAHGPRTRRFPDPATYILDKQGVVRWRMIDESWKIRPTNELILAALQKVQRGEDATSLTLDTVASTDAGVPATASRTAAAKTPATTNMALIPAGSYKLGNAPDALFIDGRFLTNDDMFVTDSPERDVYLDAYYIDKYEVTNRDYRQFLGDIAKTGDHTRCHPAEPRNKDHTPKYSTDTRYNQDDFPVVGVDWFDAFAYAVWAGKQLPTEAQWEVAARGGRPAWGPVTMDETQANINPESVEDAALKADLGRPLPVRPHGPKPVGSYKPNEFGLFDIRGNAEEWCRDWYDANYARESPRENPQGPARGVWRVVRGGSWSNSAGRSTRYQREPLRREIYLGFRCAMPASR